MIEDDDKEATRIIARQGPKQLPFRVEPPARPAASPAAPLPEPRLDVAPEPRVEDRPAPRPGVIVPPVGRPAVMLPPGGPARAGRSPLVPPPVVALPGATPSATPAAVAPPVVAQPAVVAVAPAPSVAPAEPVVGWLVVTKGPGRGASLALRGGRNALGAAPGQDLQLAFGDPAIAASGHAFLVYDEEARAFFIEDGKKKELVRINGRLLTETRSIESGDEIRVGATTLRFVAFCGPAFDWSAADAPTPAAPENDGDGI